MSFHEDEKKVELPKPEPVAPKLVFAEGLCGQCSKPMHTHDKVDCFGHPFVLRDEPDHVIAARKAEESVKASS